MTDPTPETCRDCGVADGHGMVLIRTTDLRRERWTLCPHVLAGAALTMHVCTFCETCGLGGPCDCPTKQHLPEEKTNE